MSKIIHTPKPARFIIEIKDEDHDWMPWVSHHHREEAIREADRLARVNPENQYQVVDTADLP